MSTRRRLLARLAGAAGAGTLVGTDLPTDDLDELHRDVFAESEGPIDVSSVGIDGPAYGAFDSGPIHAEPRPGGGDTGIVVAQDEVAVFVDVEADDYTASASAFMSVDCARELRARLDAAILLAEDGREL